LSLQLAWRLGRGQSSRVWLLIACIALGVCARVCVGSFSGTLERALAREARPLLGADLEIASNQPLTPEQETDLRAVLPASARTTQQVRFTTMAVAQNTNRARTVEVRAVDPDHPLYGRVVVEPAPLAQLFDPQPITFVQVELLDQLGVVVGDVIRLGEERFRIAGIIRDEPGLGANPFALGPRVLIARSMLTNTKLDSVGSRLRHARLVALPEQQITEVADALRVRWGLSDEMRSGFGGRVENQQGLGVRTAEQASASAGRVYERVGDFLRIIALAALLLGGIGVASLVRGFLVDSRDTVAVLQVLGATPWRVFIVFLWQSALVGFAGGVLGALAGVALQNLLLVLAREVLPVTTDLQIDGAAMAWGVVLGTGVAVGFAALVLLTVLSKRPAALLRDDADVRAAARWPTVVLAVMLTGLVLVVAAMEARSWRTGPAVVIALILCAVVTAAVGWLVVGLPLRIARRWFGAGSFGLRHGLANLTRPGFRPLAAIVAIAAAAHLLAAMAIYRTSLSYDIDSGGSGQRPGWFCLGLESDQVEAFTEVVRQSVGVEPLLSPMVMARLKSINGVVAAADDGSTREAERARFMRGREQRLSFRETLGADEQVISGHWMTANEQIIEASLERRFASDIGAKLGDTIAFDIQGVPLMATVTSIRHVRWSNLQPNFFVLLSPHALREVPQSWIAAIPRSENNRGAGLVAALATQFPNLTCLDVGELGAKLSVAVARIDQAVRFFGYFCLGAGVLVLIGIGIGTGRQRRGDAALLAVLGGKRRTLLASITAEFGMLGAIAATCGLLFGIAQAYVFMTAILDLVVVIPWAELAVIGFVIVVISAVSGLLACRGVFTRSPLAVLRDE
jgi:putative ABC transport system permease protein